MEDPAKMELRQWANFDQTYLKDFFRDQSTTKLTEVMAERDAALAERDKAIAERKSAYAERDAFLQQRDVAYVDRNTAWMERDSALTALTMIRANENDSESAAKLMQMVNFAANRTPVGSNLLCLPSTVNEIENAHTDVKPPQKQAKQQVKKAKKETPKKRKAVGAASQDKKGSKSSKKKRKQQAQQDEPAKIEKIKQEDISKSIVAYVAPYDLSSTPVPLCSCTGTNQQCYRWGSGGWQSACCTNFLSVYPLPVNQARRGSRVAGRKMSGGAFKKLLERLAGAGVDITKPIDLKNHWAKHGTNRYVTIK